MELSSFDELSTGLKALVVFESIGISLTAIVGCIGNFLTILVVLRTPSLQKGYNYFLVNLAIADLMINILNDPFAAFSISYREWPLPDTICMLLGLITILSCTVSVGSLVAIAINRYIVIVRWNTSSMVFTAKHSVIWCAVIWLLAVLTILPPPLDFGEFGFNKAMVACVLTHNRDSRRYMLLFLVCYFIIASIIICFCYIRIYLYIRRCHRRLEGHVQDTTADRQRNIEVRVVKNLLVVYTVFVVCWGPLLILTIADKNLTAPYILWQLAAFMAILNSSINPILYAWRSKNFRTAYRQYLCRWQQTTNNEDEVNLQSM